MTAAPASTEAQPPRQETVRTSAVPLPFLHSREWHLRTPMYMVLPAHGPPGVPVPLLGAVVQQLSPTVVVSSAARSLIADGGFGQLGVHCVPADSDGYGEAVSGCTSTDLTDDSGPHFDWA